LDGVNRQGRVLEYLYYNAWQKLKTW
jgi:hypothetical protein